MKLLWLVVGSAGSCRVWKCSKCWLGNLSTLQTHNFERTQHPDIDEKNLKILHLRYYIFGSNRSSRNANLHLNKYSQQSFSIIYYQLLILNVSAKKRHLCAGVTLASAGEYDIGMILPHPILETQRSIVSWVSWADQIKKF